MNSPWPPTPRCRCGLGVQRVENAELAPIRPARGRSRVGGSVGVWSQDELLLLPACAWIETKQQGAEPVTYKRMKPRELRCKQGGDRRGQL